MNEWKKESNQPMVNTHNYTRSLMSRRRRPALSSNRQLYLSRDGIIEFA